MPSNLYKILVSDSDFFAPQENALQDSPVSAGLFPLQDPKTLQDLYFPNTMLNMNMNLSEGYNWSEKEIADASAYVNERSLSALSKLFTDSNCLEEQDKKLNEFLENNMMELASGSSSSSCACVSTKIEANSNDDNDVENQSSANDANDSNSDDQKDEKDEKELPIDPSRVFSLVGKEAKFAFDENKDRIKIEIKTRREKPSPLIPDRLYSSLKYQLKQTATGRFCEKLPFLHSVATVVDASTKERVKKNGNDVLKGTVECSLSKPGKATVCELRGEMTIQFTDLSFHHDRREYCLEINYYLPNDLKTPVLCYRTPSFRVYSRKPAKAKKEEKKEEKLSEKKPKDKKRKREDDEQENEQGDSKRLKTNDNSDSFSLKCFSEKCLELFAFCKNMNEKDKIQAKSIMNGFISGL